MSFQPPSRPPLRPPNSPLSSLPHWRPGPQLPPSNAPFPPPNYPPPLPRNYSPARPILPYSYGPPPWSSCPPPMPLPNMLPPPTTSFVQPTLQSQQHHVGLTNLSTNPVDSILNQWLQTHEPIFQERQQRNRDNRIGIPSFRSKLLRWTYLTEQIKLLQSEKQTVPPCLISELSDLQAYCSDPHIIDQVKSKLHSIRKKRRYRQRVKNHLLIQNQSSIVLRTSTCSILDRLNEQPINLSSLVPAQNNPSTDQDVKSTSLENNEQPAQSTNSNLYEESMVKLRKLITKCTNHDTLLTNLAKLRDARLSQARQRGGLFPEQLDEQFTEQVDELRSLIKGEQSKLEALVSMIQKKSTPKLDDDRTEQLVCSKHMPHIPDHLKLILFGDESSYLDVPWRWKRFYHQAQFDFVDFIRIRSSWDSYLIQPNTTETTQSDHAESTESELSKLPQHWILPPDEPSSEAWKQYLRDCDQFD